jgi:hypothetical protein
MKRPCQALAGGRVVDHLILAVLEVLLVQHDGAGHLDLPHGRLPPVPGQLVLTAERHRQAVQPPLGEHLDGAGLQPVADRLQPVRIVAGGEPVGQGGEGDPGLECLPLGPLVPADPDLGRVGEVDADLDERRAEVLIPPLVVVARHQPPSICRSH